MAEEKDDSTPRFDHEEYDMLSRCSKKEDMSEWNDWREENQVERWVVFLDRAYLNDKWLKGADLTRAHLADGNLNGAKLQKADLTCAYLHRAHLRNARLQGAILVQAELEGADLYGAKLQGADLSGAYLQGARLENANLMGAKFTLAALDGVSLIKDCKFDSETDFTGVGLDSVRIEPGIKAALKNNIRRTDWKAWYRKGSCWKKILINPFVRLFWFISDYGRSTSRLILFFIFCVLVFASVYLAFETVPGLQGIIQNLRLEAKPSIWHVAWRALYFSVVTMTTLGFGDMHAVENACIWGFLGCLLLSLQVTLGYVVLGALITRIGILFTSEAPAAKPTPKDEKYDNND